MSNGVIILTHNTFLDSYEYWIREALELNGLHVAIRDCHINAADRLLVSIKMLDEEINKKYCE